MRLFNILFCSGLAIASPNFASARVVDDLLSTAPFVGLNIEINNCFMMTDEVAQVAKTMIELRETCPPLKDASSAGKPIMVTNYSKEGAQGTFVFDNNGKCVKTFMTSSCGNGGRGSSTPPAHCSVDGSNYSPAGLHMIKERIPAGKKYHSRNSFLMKPLDEQNSDDRHILVHGGHPAPKSSTLGCLGLSNLEFKDFQKIQPVDGLIYNYFGDTKKASNCRESKGYRPNGAMPSCQEVAKNLDTNYRPRNNPHDSGVQNSVDAGEAGKIQFSSPFDGVDVDPSAGGDQHSVNFETAEK